jgi:N-sulfoglucosamine sulfohydrolase
VVPEEQLFDLVFDPHESRDLSGDPGRAKVLAAMRRRLEDWIAETDDPLLEGPITAPPGAAVNDPSQSSPNDPWRATDPAPPAAAS